MKDYLIGRHERKGSIGSTRGSTRTHKGKLRNKKEEKKKLRCNVLILLAVNL